MKAVAPRLEKLYASEIERWRDAWKRFDETLWSHMTPDEQRAYAELYDPERDAGQDDAVESVVQSMVDEWDALVNNTPSPPEDMERADAFIKGFLDTLPRTLDAVDLTRWPEQMPYPPDDKDRETVRKEEDALVRLCRSRKGTGTMERLASAWLIFTVAMCRTARAYSSEKP